MSMIEREIEQLEALKTAMQLDVDLGRVKAHGSIKNRLKVVDSAIDTIKTQSEKLHAYAMERSSQHYHDGWIPCSECKPEYFIDVLLQYNPAEEQNQIMVGHYCPAGKYPAGGKTEAWFIGGEYYKYIDDVIAWQPLPELYEEE